jgi:hypothetical protein
MTFAAMQEYLGLHAKEKLLWTPGVLNGKFGFANVNRSAQRSCNILICTYCDSFPNILNNFVFLSDIISGYCKPFPGKQLRSE